MEFANSVDLNSEVRIVLRLFLALLLGAGIGFDREKHGRSAGIRTYAAVCMGATLFTAIGEHMGDVAAASRIIANVLVGIGFLGAGIIYKNHETNSSQGLTTAATIWCTAGIGVAVGLNMLLIAVMSSAGLYFLLSMYHQRWYVNWKNKLKSSSQSDKEYD